ncbi:OLC1v1011295C1 [Oldenlandia corymbosa var. corymbosa]|uniref:Cytochrome P450 724B1 n=1 Tax=Oldenlandia corymbosa var. corymbosa TaxID=529605 RepID=A0AAV1DVQ4_OLDCO|nr:OLC1v1011295C1 [Oldenlandia corymbosa var. corymbosa]
MYIKDVNQFFLIHKKKKKEKMLRNKMGGIQFSDITAMPQFAVVVLALALGLLPLLISYLSVRFHSVKQSNNNKKEKIPDGSMGFWPVLGETFDFLKSHPSTSMGQFLEDRRSKYGDVFKSHLFGSPTIVSCDMEMNLFILQNEGKLFRSSYPKSVSDILGSGSMLIVTGDQHKKVRSTAANHIATSKSRPEFLNYVDKLSTSLMKSWQKLPRGEKVPFFQVAKEFTMGVMLKNLIDMEPEDPLAPMFFNDFLTFAKGFVSLPVYLPGSPYAKAVKARTRISSTLRSIMEDRKKRQSGDSVTSPSSSRGDFLDGLLKKEAMSDEEVVDLVRDLLLAGYETTSGLMGLVVYFLSQSPKALQHLREEHRKIRAEKPPGEPLNLKDYKQMEFTMKVINEALRCGNLVKFVHRKAVKDVEFKGYLIPQGWKVLPVLLSPHLDQSLHDHPTRFDPWRWEDEATIKKVMPFGAGARLCPGAEIARVETSFFLHHLILNYSWKIAEDESPVVFPYLDFRRAMLLQIEPLEDNALN